MSNLDNANNSSNFHLSFKIKEKLKQTNNESTDSSIHNDINNGIKYYNKNTASNEELEDEIAYKKLIKRYLSIGFPIFLFFLSATLYETINICIVGNFISEYQTVIGIASSYLTMTFYTLLRSFPAGFETLGSILISQQTDSKSGSFNADIQSEINNETENSKEKSNISEKLLGEKINNCKESSSNTETSNQILKNNNNNILQEDFISNSFKVDSEDLKRKDKCITNTSSEVNKSFISTTEEKFTELIIMMNHTITAITLLTIIIVIIQLILNHFCTNLLVSDEKQRNELSLYLMIIMPCGFIESYNNVYFRYYNIIEKNYVNPIFFMTGTIAQSSFSWYYIRYLEFGLSGAALATISSKIIISILYYFSECQVNPYYKYTVSYFSWKTFSRVGIKETYSLFIFCMRACLSCYLLWINLEIVGFVCYYIDNVKLYKIYLISYSIYYLNYSVNFAIEIVSSIITSKLVVKCDCFNLMKKLFMRSYAISICWCGSYSLLILIFRKPLVILFIDNDLKQDSEFIDDCCNAVLASCFTILLDNSQNLLCGILRGLGLFRKTIPVNIFIFYFVIPSLVILFCFVLKLGIIYVWVSMAIGFSISFSIFLYYIFNIDYDVCRENIIKETIDASK